MGTCSDKLTDAQRHEITELLSASAERRIKLLMGHYGMCEDCALHVMATTLLVLFRFRKGSTMKVEDAISAVMAGVSKVYDIPIVSFNRKEDLDAFTNDLSSMDKSKLH